MAHQMDNPAAQISEKGCDIEGDIPHVDNLKDGSALVARLRIRSDDLSFRLSTESGSTDRHCAAWLLLAPLEVQP